MATYCYAPLSHEMSEIRLLSIEAGPLEAEIRCHLHHVSLDDNPQYEALSYTWGDSTDLRTIILGDGPWSVTANLQVALQYLRSEEEPKTMWIDALCIDQTNLAEKSEQVPMMQQIFNVAAQVVAWIGLPSSPDEDAAMDDIKDLATKWDQDATPIAGITHQDLLEMDINTSNYNWSGIWSLLNRPYWKRVWVIQELASCGINTDKKGIVVCGSKSVPKWMCDAICMLLLLVGRSPGFWDNKGNLAEPVRSLLYRGVPAAQFMFLILLLVDNEEDDSDKRALGTLLLRAGNFLATDLHDKIYALIGLARKQDHLLAPDYSEPAEQVIEAWAKELIRHDTCLSILLYNRKGTNGFGPSWIPDLFEVPASGPAWADEEQRCQAATCLEAEVDFDDSSHAIYVQGFEIGVCDVAIGPILPSRPLNQPDQHSASDFRQQANMAEKTGTMERLREFLRTFPESEHETCWRTLVMDGDLSDFDEPLFPAPAHFGTNYHRFLEGTIPQDFKPDLSEEIRHIEYGRSSTFASNLFECISYRCFFKTSCGKTGIGPYYSKDGDIVAAFFGAGRFAVLRPRGDDTYELVGDAYVQGGMSGEFVKEKLERNALSRRFAIC